MTAEMIQRLNEACPALKAAQLGTVVDEILNSLGVIRGDKIYVDPYGGSKGGDGTKNEPVSDFEIAYNRVRDGEGDGIIVFSGGTTAVHTTSYLKKPLLWTKSDITVLGIAAPTRMFGRARIANKEITSSGTTFAQTTGSITRETGDFAADGWIVGMTGYIADSGANNGATFTVTAVTALTLTVSETLTAQTKAQTVSCVLTSYNSEMIVMSGANNQMFGMHVANFGSQAGALGCLKVTGARNFIDRCHLIGAGHATPGAVVGAYDLELNGAQEFTAEKCTFGTDTIAREAANGNIRFDSHVWRSLFEGCHIVSHSATAGKGAILSADADSMDGIQKFINCHFLNWNPNGITPLTSAFIGTKPTSGAIFVSPPSMLGWSAWDSVGGNDMVYVTGPAANAAGGIGATP